MPIINLHPATSYEPSGEHAPNARDLQGKVALRDRPHLPRLVSDRVVPNDLVDHRGGERRYRSTAPPARNSSVARRGCSSRRFIGGGMAPVVLSVPAAALTARLPHRSRHGRCRSSYRRWAIHTPPAGPRRLWSPAGPGG